MAFKIFLPLILVLLPKLSTRLEINVFSAAITDVLLRWPLLAVLALRRTRRLASHPVFLAKIRMVSVRILSSAVAQERNFILPASFPFP
ncbi:MAG: hypothetical protein AB1584_24340 [Pseudomonadota bacterium]